MKVKFLDLKKQYASIKQEIDERVSEILNSCEFVGGRYVSEFENEFTKSIGVKHTLGVGNGTDALEIAIKSLNLPKNSTIIVPANTFVASLEAIINSGHKALIVDCKDDYSMELKEEHITPEVSAVMIVHIYGRIGDIDTILELATKHNLKIIEDCAQSYGAIDTKTQKSSGSIGDVGCFSFYPGKNLGAYGDGGAIVTDNTQVYQMAKSIANHGREQSRYQHTLIGRNSRLDGLQAGILSIKLKHIQKWNLHRATIANLYHQNLSSLKAQIKLPPVLEQKECVWHLYVVRCIGNIEGRRDELVEFLKQEGIECGIHYPSPISTLIKESTQPQNATKFAKSILSLPMGEHLTQVQVAYVCEKIHQFCKKYQ